MGSQWFYQLMGERIGPVTAAELRNLAQRGMISTESPIANAPNGPWVPAARVKGLFAAPVGTPPSTATATAAQVPPDDPAARAELSGLSTATKIVMGACGGVCVLAIGLLVWFIATHDTWELDNMPRVSAKLEEADRLQQSDPFAAYKMYDEVLNEAKQHKVKEERFAKKLADAEKSQAALYPKVQEKIRAEEAEKKRLAQEEAKRTAEEKQRIAHEEERKRAAEQKELAEEKALKDALIAYRNVPQSARNALNAVKKLEARTEVGISYKDYSTAVGEAWGDAKVFAESSEGKELSAFSFLLVSAIGKYKLGLDVWRGKNDSDEHLCFDDGPSDALLQECWRAGSARVKAAQHLLDRQGPANALARTDALRTADAVYEKTMRSLFPELILAHLAGRLVGMDRDNVKYRDDYAKTLETISAALKGVVAEDVKAFEDM